MLSKLTIVLVGAICLVGSIEAHGGLDSSDWSAYKAQFGKSYANPEEDSMRHEIFVRNKQKVEQHNADSEASFKLRLNHLSDRTEEEKNRLLGFRSNVEGLMLEHPAYGEQFLAKVLGNRSEPLPESVDWRKEPGRVSHVKDQEDCGSCWAFSTTGLLEGQQLRLTKGKELISLSEQNLVDCAKPNGCDGNWPSAALQYIFESGGIDSEVKYPYKGYEQHCRYDKTASVMKIRGPVVLPQSEEFLQAVVAKYGPVSVGIDATSIFMQYGSGVLHDKECQQTIENLNHAVLLVGYGTDAAGGDYWLVKNSWGVNWGEKGYIRMARNKGNLCGVATLAVIAAFDEFE